MSMPPPEPFVNSAMSNPALNLPPDPVTTMAFTSERLWACLTASKRLANTARFGTCQISCGLLPPGGGGVSDATSPIVVSSECVSQ